jgi:hypothetical protein
MLPLSRRQVYNVSMGKFEVIQGTPPADTPRQRLIDRIKAAPNPGAIIQCTRCGSREVLELRIGVELKNGKPTGGTSQIVCAACFLKGERIVLA